MASSLWPRHARTTVSISCAASGSACRGGASYPHSTSWRRSWSRWGSTSEVVAARKTVLCSPAGAAAGRGAELLQELRDVERHVVDALVEALLGDLAERLVELADAAHRRVALKNS